MAARTEYPPGQLKDGVLKPDLYDPTLNPAYAELEDTTDRLKPSMWRPSERCCWSVPASAAATRARIAG